MPRKFMNLQEALHLEKVNISTCDSQDDSCG